MASKVKICSILGRAALLCLVLLLGRPSGAYSVLTHEEVVDLLWKDQILPLLNARFPGATNEDLRRAHAYAYGGSLIQDMGYYPFGSKYFSDLVHYVRTGDFVEALLQESTTREEYAFALGALSHYAADTMGHPVINKVVAMTFPKLEERYGKAVTYADDAKSHIRVEFGFDMEQVAKNRYTSDSYHDFIGFQVAKGQLERAFQDTYDMPLNEVIHDEDLAIGSYRRAISRIIPEMTRVALLSRKKEIVAETPNFNKRQFLYRLSRTEYQKQWGEGYSKPGFGTRMLAFFLKIVPKVGPFRAVAFQIPTTQTEDLYIKSIDSTTNRYQALLKEQKAKDVNLVNIDFDTGKPPARGEYPLADETYAKLLDDQAKKNFSNTSGALKANILAFYRSSSPEKSAPTKQNEKKSQTKTASLDDLLRRLQAASPTEKSPLPKS